MTDDIKEKEDCECRHNGSTYSKVFCTECGKGNCAQCSILGDMKKQFMMFVPNDDGSAMDWLENTIDQALTAERERIVVEIVNYWGHLDNDGNGNRLNIPEEEQRKDILNLIQSNK